MSHYFTEFEAAAYLRGKGVPMRPRTLANKRWSGDGPLFVKIGLRVRYRRADLDAYAEEVIGPPVRSTSDALRVHGDRAVDPRPRHSRAGDGVAGVGPLRTVVRDGAGPS